MARCVDTMNDVLRLIRDPDTRLHEDSLDFLQEHGVYVIRNAAWDGGNIILIDKEHDRQHLPPRQAIFDSLVAKMDLTADQKQRLRWAFEARDYSPYAQQQSESSSAAQGPAENALSQPRRGRIVDVGMAAWVKARENKPFGFLPPADAENAVGRMDFQLEMGFPGHFPQKYCFDRRDTLLFNEDQAFSGEELWRPLMAGSGVAMEFKLTSTDLPYTIGSEAVAVNMADFLTDKLYSNWSLPEVMAGEGVLAPGAAADDGSDTDEISDLEEWLAQGTPALADGFSRRWGCRLTKRFGFLRDLNEGQTLHVYWTKNPMKLTTFLPDDPIVLNMGGEPILVDVDDRKRLAEVMSLERNDVAIEHIIRDEQLDRRVRGDGPSDWRPMCLGCERRKWAHYEKLVQKLWCLLWSHEIKDHEEWVAIFGERDHRYRALPLDNEWVQEKLRHCPVIKGCFCFKLEYEASPGWYQ